MSGIVIGTAIAIGMVSYYAEPTPRMFTVAGAGLAGGVFFLLDAVKSYDRAYRRERVVELRSLGVAE